MNTPIVRTLMRTVLLGGCLTIAGFIQAADVVKADNADNLTLTTSWVGGVVPTSADVAVWDGTITLANTTLLDVSANWAGIRIASPVGTVTITSNNPAGVLGLGASGIDLSAATADLVITAPVSNLVNQTCTIASGRTLTLNGPLLGGGRLTKIGPGTLVPLSGGAGLNGAFAGGLTIAEATVQTTAALNGGVVSTIIGTNTLILTNGGRLRFNNSSGTGGLNYNVPLQMDGAGTISFRANSSWGSPPITGSGVLTIDVNNGGTGPVFTPTSFTSWNGQINFTSGSGGCSLRLATGYLNNSLTNASVNLANSGVGLNRQTASAVVVEIGTLSGVVGSSVNGNNVRTGWRNEDSTFAGIFTGANGGITKVGSGTMTLTANSTHSGNNTVQGGKLLCITGGSFSNSANTFVTNGAVLGVQLASAGGQWSVGTNLVFTAVPAATNTLEFNYVGFPASTVTAPLQVRGNVTNTGPVNVSIKGGGWAVGTYPLISYSGVLSGLGYSGFVITNLPNGILGYITNDTASTLSLVVTNSALPLHWRVGNGNWDIAATTNWKDNNGVTTTYQEVGGSGDPVQLDDTASGSSPITITLAANVTPSGVTVTNGSKNYVLAGANAIGGGTPVTKLGSGTLTLQNNNTFTGGLNLNGGTVEFTANENLGASNSPVTFGGGTLRYATGATADFSTRTVTFAAGGATIDDNANTVVLSRPIGNNGAGSFTKTGAGSLTLTGTNRYSGPTTVANGTLALATATTYISNSPSINLAGSGTLSGTLALSAPVSQLLYGTGTVVGDVTVPAATRISPATNGVYGRLTNSGSLTVSGGTLSMDVSKTNRDEIVVSGNVAFTSGTLALNFTDVLTNGTYRLLQCGSVTAGSEANLVITSAGVAQPNKVLSLSEAVAGRIDLVVSGFRGSNIVWVGDSLLNYWDVETSFNWTNLATATIEHFVGGDKVTFDDTGSAAPDVNLQDLVQPGLVTVSNFANNYIFSTTGSGKIGGSTALIKAGSGPLTITTENNNTGGTLVSGGLLQVGNGGTGDIGPGLVTNNALVVFNQGTDHTVAAISGTGNLEQLGPSLLTFTGSNTYVGSTTIGASSRLRVGTGGAVGALGTGPVTNNGVLVFNRTGTHTVANGIAGTGSLQKVGTSVLTLGGVNTYENNTYISNGVVKLASSEVIPNGGTTTGWLILDGGATAGQLDLNGFNETVNALSGLGGASLGLVTNSAASPITTNTLTLNQAFATTYAGLIAENPTGAKIAVVKNGIGDLNLPINNPFSGGMWLMEGIVNATGGSPCGTGLLTFSNGTYNMSGSSFPGNIGLVVGGGNATLTSSSLANGWAGSFMSTNDNCTLNIGANVSFSSGNVKQFSNYTGVVNILATGGLRFSASSGLNNGGENATFVINSGGNLECRNAGTVTLGALSGSGTINDMQDGASTGTCNYIIGGKNVDSTFSGTIVGLNPQFNAIVKTGTAKLTFDGTLTYGGATTVSNGVLAIAGTAEITNTPTIRILQGATLDMTASTSGGLNLGAVIAQTLTGAGTNLGTLTVAAGSTVTVGDGTAIGTLAVSGNITLGGTLNLDLNKTNAQTSDKLVTTGGTLTGGGTLAVQNIGPVLQVGDSFQLFPSAVSGFTTVNLSTIDNNGAVYQWTNKVAINGSIQVIGVTERIFAVTTVNELISFGSTAPGTVLSSVAITGLQSGEAVVGIGFRTNTLYAVGNSSRLYTINRTTGAATVVGGQFSPVLSGQNFGMEIEAGGVRVVSSLDQNLLLDFATGAATVGTTVNGTPDPTVDGIARHPGTGQYYAADHVLNTIGTFDPVTGTANVTNSSLIDFSRDNGFGISPGTNNTAYLASPATSSGPEANLYRIILTPGPTFGNSALVGLIGNAGDNILVRGLAVGPDFSATTTPAINPNPTNITFSATGGNLNLSWPASHIGWILQSQTNSRAIGLRTNWADITGSESITVTNFPLVSTNPTVFYRLRKP